MDTPAGQAFRNLASKEADPNAEANLILEKYGIADGQTQAPQVQQFKQNITQQATQIAKEKVEPKLTADAGGLQNTNPDVNTQMGGPVKDATTGLAKGIGQALQNAWNIIDNVDQLVSAPFSSASGKNMTVTQGAMRANFMDHVPKGNGTEQLFSAMGQYVLPFMVGSGVTSAIGEASGLGTNMATNMLINMAVGDPHGERFLAKIQEHFPALSNPISTWMAAPETSAAEGMLKNGIDGLIPDAALNGLIFGTAKAIKGLQGVVGKPSRILQAEQQGIEAGAKVSPQPIMAEDAVANNELRALLSEQNGAIDTAKAVEHPVVKESIASANTSILPTEIAEKVDSIRVAPEQKIQPIVQGFIERKAGESAKLGEQSFTKMDKEAIQYINDNPNSFTNLIKGYKAGDAITTSQKRAIQLFTEDLFKQVTDSAKRAKDTGLALDAVAHEQKLLQFEIAANAFGGVSESSGRELRILQTSKTVGDQIKFDASIKMAKSMGGINAMLPEAERIMRMNKVLGPTTGLKLWSAVAQRIGKNVAETVNYIGLNGLSSASAPVNAVSGFLKNLGNIATDLNVKLLGIVPGVGEDFKTASKMASYKLAGNAAAFAEASREALHTVQTGETFLPSIYKFEEFERTAEQRAAEASEAPGKAAAFFTELMASGNRGFELVGQRANKTQDAFNGMLSYRRSIISQAAQSGVEAGLTGTHLDKWVASRIAAPTKDMHEAALVLAKEPTMGLTYGEMMGNNPASRLFNGIDGFLSSFGLAPVVPFLKARVNEMVQTLEHTPMLGALAPNNFAALMNGGPQRAEALAKMMVGAEIIGGGLVLNHFTGLEITGGGPTDPATLKALRHTNPGYLPYAIGFPGGQHYSFERYGPLTNLLKVVGDYRELSNFQDEGEKTKMAYGVMASIVETLTPTQLTKDLPNLMEGLRSMADNPDPNKLSQFLSEHAMNYVPLSGISRGIRKDADFLRRETITDTPIGNFLAQFKNTIPGYSYDLPPSRNKFGEVVSYPIGWSPQAISPFFGSDGDDVLSKELMRLGVYNTKLVEAPAGTTKLDIGMPPHVIGFNGGGGAMGSIKLTEWEYDQLVKFSGGIEVPTSIFGDVGAKTLGQMSDSDANMYAEQYADGGTMKPLKQALSEGLQEIEAQHSGQSSRASKLQIDEEKRSVVKAICTAYEKMGKAAMIMSPRIFKAYMDAIDARANILEGR